MERDQDGGALDPNATVGASGKTVLDVLKEKHPLPREVHENAFLPCDELPILTCVDITGAHLENAARQIKGGAGPGGTTAQNWQDFLLWHGSRSEQLRDAMAELARRIANTIIDWHDIQVPMACRPTALDKCPGVCPICDGEVPRHILSKVMAAATCADVEELYGTNQLCSGLKAGIEGAVHAMNELFEESLGTGWGLLLVDAFNSVSRVAALWNVRVLWLSCSCYLFNCYCDDVQSRWYLEQKSMCSAERA